MTRPPLWVWGLPAAVALGLLLGLRMRTATLSPPPPPRHTAARATVPAMPMPTTADTSATAVPEQVLVPDPAGWGPDGGVYRPLDGDTASDTLPAAPEVVVSAPPEPGPMTIPDPPAPPPPPARVAERPAQGLGREAAYGRPLVAAVRGGGRLSFYSAWDAPATRASLVGEWARVGSCAGAVRVGYEQVVAGLGAVRGAGDAAEAPSWDVALVVPRQHCAGAGARWQRARAPSAEEAALLAPLFPGERPAVVAGEGDRLWAASPRRAVVARIAGGRAVERWSAVAPEGASIRLLGLWEGDGVWAAVETGGRVVRVWRVPG